MGRKHWTFFVPFQPDLSRALKELTADVYKRRGHKVPAGPSDFDADFSLKVASRDPELIIGLMHIGSYWSPAGITPIDDGVLEAVFGSSRPTRSEVENHLFWLVDETAGIGEGFYVVLYQAAEPTEIVFTGFTYE